MTEIGSFEAKTHFSDLLRRVTGAGEKFIVTVRGKPVAMLGPVEPRKPSQEDISKLLESLRAFRANVGPVTKPGETLKEIARKGLR